MNRILKFFAFFCCSLFLAACGDSNTCQKEVNTWLQANAYEMYYNTETEMMEAKALSIPFVVYGVNNDSILYQGNNISAFSLPLNKFDSITEFVFSTPFVQVQDTVSDTIFVNDTLSFYHKNELVLVSLECGCTVNYTIDAFSFTVNAIDSVVLISNEVQVGTKNNFNIYFKR